MTDNSNRLQRNDESRNQASRHRLPWEPEELEKLFGFWDGSEETLLEIAELLGRTVEACRQRYYYPEGQHHESTRVPQHVSGWLIDYCSTCGRHTDVWCNGTAVRLCEDCR